MAASLLFSSGVAQLAHPSSPAAHPRTPATNPTSPPSRAAIPASPPSRVARPSLPTGRDRVQTQERIEHCQSTRSAGLADLRRRRLRAQIDRILAVLRREHVQAIFFPIGSWARRQPRPGAPHRSRGSPDRRPHPRPRRPREGQDAKATCADRSTARRTRRGLRTPAAAAVRRGRLHRAAARPGRLRRPEAVHLDGRHPRLDRFVGGDDRPPGGARRRRSPRRSRAGGVDHHAHERRAHRSCAARRHPRRPGAWTAPARSATLRPGRPRTPPVTADDVLATARRLADDVLFPAALEVDAAELVPRSHLDTLAANGLYGLLGTDRCRWPRPRRGRPVPVSWSRSPAAA